MQMGRQGVTSCCAVYHCNIAQDKVLRLLALPMSGWPQYGERQLMEPSAPGTSLATGRPGDSSEALCMSGQIAESGIQ